MHVGSSTLLSMNYKAYAVVLDSVTGLPMKHRMLKFTSDAKAWQDEDDKEIVRLTSKTKIMRPILPHQKPSDRLASYYNPQASTKTADGDVVRRIRGTYGGDRGDPYPEDTAAYVANLTTAKLLLNFVVSTPKARFMTMDITDFYLNTTLKRKAYMWIRKDLLSDKSIELLGVQDPGDGKTTSYYLKFQKAYMAS